MDYIARRHVAGCGLDRLAEADWRLLVRLPLHLGAAGAGDRRGHTAAVPQFCVGRVGDRVHLELGHVSLRYL